VVERSGRSTLASDTSENDPNSQPSFGQLALRAARRVYRLLLYPIYFLSGLVPRDPHRWVFGARNGLFFEGNSKWLYLYVARFEADVQAVWITRRKEIVAMLRKQGLTSYLRNSPRGIWEQLRAGAFVVILNSPDINYWTKRGALFANIQHGTPFKRFGRDVRDAANPLFKNHNANALQRLAMKVGVPSTYEYADFVASTSRESSDRWSSALGIPRHWIAETGNPRNDALVAEAYEPDDWDRSWFELLNGHKRAGKKVISYLPTFRHAAGTAREAPIDWTRLNQFFAAQQIHAWIRWHPGDERPLPEVGHLDAISLIPGEIDLAPLLRLTDLLITDYSSAYFDFLLLDRPIVFYAYDKQSYLAEGKTLYENYEDVTPGPIVTNFEQLLEVLKREGDADLYADARAELRQRTHDNLDAGASRRVYESIRDRLNAS
jgi:CDP-glycerol glycerophosphotransferase (TagB/SpsB family)